VAGAATGARPVPTVRVPVVGTIDPMTEAEGTIQEQLDDIGVQLSWVRDYL